VPEFKYDRPNLEFLPSASLSLKSQDPGAGRILARVHDQVITLIEQAAEEIAKDQQIRGVVPIPDPGACAGCGG